METPATTMRLTAKTKDDLDTIVESYMLNGRTEAVEFIADWFVRCLPEVTIIPKKKSRKKKNGVLTS